MSKILINALSKYLDAFLLNFSSDKLNLQLFKGNVSLQNVELNTVVLQSLLDLPPSLRLVQAICSTVDIKVRGCSNVLCA